MPKSHESDLCFNHRAQHVTNRCALTPTIHGQIVRQSRNSPDPKQQSAEFPNSPCLKKPLTKQLIARLSFLTTRHSLFTLRRALSRPDRTVKLSLNRSGKSEVCEFVLKNWQKGILEP